MSKSYHPDGWTVLKFTDNGIVIYKIFATWRWDNDRWRLSSGANDLSGLMRVGDEFIWPQASGSVYHLPIDGEHCSTLYQSAVFDNIQEKCINENIEYEILNLRDYAGLN
jgi:hypothetical protein